MVKKIHRGFEIQAYASMPADLYVVKKKKKCQVLEFTVPAVSLTREYNRIVYGPRKGANGIVE